MTSQYNENGEGKTTFGASQTTPANELWNAHSTGEVKKAVELGLVQGAARKLGGGVVALILAVLHIDS